MWFGFVKDSINVDTILYCLKIIYYMVRNNFQPILSIERQFRSWLTIDELPVHTDWLVIWDLGQGSRGSP